MKHADDMDIGAQFNDFLIVLLPILILSFVVFIAYREFRRNK